MHPRFGCCCPRHHHLWGVAALWCPKCDLSSQGGELATCLSPKGGMSLEQPQLVLSEFGGSGKVSALPQLTGCEAVPQRALGRSFINFSPHLPLILVSFCRVSGHVLFLTLVLVRRVLHYYYSLNPALTFYGHFCIYVTTQQKKKIELLPILMGQILLWADENFVIGLAPDCKVAQATPKDVCFKGLSQLIL